MIGHQRPGGGGSVGVVGPGGGRAGVIVGPAGGAVGGIRGPGGGAAAGARGPWGGRAAVARLPDGSTHVRWNGADYWRHNGRWYDGHWDGDGIWYWPVYPPVGWWTPTIDYGDVQYTTIVINDSTYYESEGVYYEKATQNGQEGYAVVAEPKQAATRTDAGLPDPFEVLKKSLDYLAKLPEFTISASDAYDEVTEDGQKVSFTSQRTMYVKRPGRVAIDFRDADESRKTVLDGKQVTLIDRVKNLYGQAPTPATIDESLDKLSSDYGITVAIAELVRTNLYARVFPKIQTGQYLGKDTIGVYECDHLGFTTPDVDWEAWFQTGDKPLLRKLSISYKQAPSRPRYTMLFSRFDVSEVPDYVFKADIPAGAVHIEPRPVNAGGATTKPADKP